MNKSFEKFKRNDWIAAVGMSLAIGVFVGLFSVGAVLLTLKLCGVVIDALYYALIGGGMAAVSFALALLFLRPNGKKVAKNLDTEFALNEKVQTAYEFSSATGAMVERQRADAYDTLDALPRRHVRTGKLFAYLCAGIVAFALFFAAAFVPFRNVGAQTEDPPFELTDWQADNIRFLIENVQKSGLAAEEKSGAVAALNEFIEALGEAKTESAKLAALDATLEKVSSILLPPNSYPDLASRLQAAGQQDLAEMLTRGGETYRVYTLLKYEDVAGFYETKTILVEERLEKRWEEYRALFADGDDLGVRLAEAAGAAASAVLLSEYPASDPLCDILNEYSLELYKIRDELAGTPEAAEEEPEPEPEPGPELSPAQKELDSLFGMMFDALTSSLGDQSYRGAMDRHIGNYLKNLFGLPIEAGEPDPEGTGDGSDDPTKPPDDDNEDDQGSGGWGSGQTQYGSNDEVYDPAVGGYVQYGKILDEYSAEMQKLLRSGDLTEEQRAMVQRYIEMLYGGIPAEE